MSIFAISDLHLSKANPKPMDIFGYNWMGHWDKIREDWAEKVEEGDMVLVPGDISWALALDEALPDLMEISQMPGRKVLIRGNHDYWWESPAKIRSLMPDDIEIIQNDFIDAGDFYICGTRGWILPGDDRFQEKDSKIFNRELIRLELSLSKAAQYGDNPIILMIHFPPFNERNDPSEFISVMKKYNVRICIYGHLHGESLKNIDDCNYEGIQFFMVSCDYLNFKLKKIY